MIMTYHDQSEFVIEDVAGCGMFQVVFFFCIAIICQSTVAMTISSMAFSLYNPGWRCLDNYDNTSSSPYNVTTSSTSGVWTPVDTGFDDDNNNSSSDTTGTCDVFKSCRLVQFNDHTSTIAQEWGLICDLSWIGSAIVSIQMCGLLVGAPIVGHLGDVIGRKPTMYLGMASLTVLSFVAIFSVSWEMFAVIRFFQGISCMTLMGLDYVYLAELTPKKWRYIVSANHPWLVAIIFSGVAFMLLKDWRHLQILITLLGLVSILTAWWVPESLKWLEAKNKRSEFNKVANKIAKMNGKRLPALEDLHQTMGDNSLVVEGEWENQKSTFADLFRRGYWRYTLILSLEWFTLVVIYYFIFFGVKSMHGNFYLNFILLNVISLVFKTVFFRCPSVLGRRWSSVAFLAMCSVCLLVSAGFRLSPHFVLQTTGVTVLLLLAKGANDGVWISMKMHTSEIYPTIVRSRGQNWNNMISRAGGIIAPFLVPKDPETSHVNYGIMGVLGLVCALAVLGLPETKGKPLSHTFNQGHLKARTPHQSHSHV